MASLSGRQIRDFIYLDIDRMRSFVAQLYEGVPEIFEEMRGQERGAQAEAGINIPLLGKAGMGGDMLYQKSTTETKSAHHYLYSLFEQKLSELDRLLKVDADFQKSAWVPDSFRDGMFVLVQGRVQIIDYRSVVVVLEAMPRIVELTVTFNRQVLKRQLEEGNINQREYEKRLRSTEISGLSKKDISGVAEMVGKLYSGVSRVKVFPFANQQEYCFVGNAPYQYFSTEQISPFLSYGLLSGANWFVMGLVNEASTSPHAPSFKPTESSIQNLEDSLEQLVFLMQEMGKVTLSIQFPAISFVPVAVYRPC